MATFGQMTDEVSRKLAGFTLRQDRQTHLIAYHVRMIDADI